MNVRTLALGVVLGAAAAVSAQRVFSDGEPKEPAGAVDLTSPGPEHQAMAAYLGTWDVKGTMQQPGAEPMSITAEAVHTSLYGGRFLQREETTHMGGVEQKWLGLFGFDRVRNVFTHYEIGSTQTHALLSEGTHDAAKKAIVLAGSEPQPGGGGTKYEVRVGDVVDGAYHLEAWFDVGGTLKKMYEADYRKRK